jgi:chorismate mutase
MSLFAQVAEAIEAPTVCAIRGATVVDCDEPAAIAAAVVELLTAISDSNQLLAHQIISAIFTVTPDLVSAFPAEAARTVGWQGVPLICAMEIPVPGALPRCLRVMVHIQHAGPRPQPRHVYLGAAAQLRPDLQPVSN